jgi:hypothetical protein
VRFSQPFEVQSVATSYNGVFKPIVGSSNRLHFKTLQKSHSKNAQSRALAKQPLSQLWPFFGAIFATF